MNHLGVEIHLRLDSNMRQHLDGVNVIRSFRTSESNHFRPSDISFAFDSMLSRSFCHLKEESDLIPEIFIVLRGRHLVHHTSGRRLPLERFSDSHGIYSGGLSLAPPVTSGSDNERLANQRARIPAAALQLPHWSSEFRRSTLHRAREYSRWAEKVQLK